MKKMHSIAKVLLPVGVLLLGAACSTMAPQYSRPPAPVASDWPSGDAYEKTKVENGMRAVSDLPWEDFFAHEPLRRVITQALANNRDLRVALLNIERSRALFQIRRAELFPEVDASAAALYQQVPADLSTSRRATKVEQYNVGLGVSAYELDLFGRVRSLKAQALEQYLATEEAGRSVQMNLISQVANAWLALAADRERLQLAEETLANQREAFKLTEGRYKAGVSSALDLNRARSSVDTARVDIARYTALVAQDANALNLLVGATVPIEQLPEALSDAPFSLESIAPGLPSEVLLSRPDILQAERELMAANASIGAARAAFFPRITLVSSAGYASDALSGLFTGDSFAWSFAPRISLPIFDAGSNRANLKVSEADRNIAVARYEKAIQTAFREVADALAQQGTLDEQLAAQQSLTDANGETFRLSEARYEKGVDSYLSVLDAQRSLYGSQQSLISTRLARLANRVTLYKVLGGGS